MGYLTLIHTLQHCKAHGHDGCVTALKSDDDTPPLASRRTRGSGLLPHRVLFSFLLFLSQQSQQSWGPAAPDILDDEVAKPGEATGTPRASPPQPRALFPCPLPPTVLWAEQGGRATPPMMQAGAGAASRVPGTWLATFRPGLRSRAGTLASGSDEAGVRCSPTLAHPFSPP